MRGVRGARPAVLHCKCSPKASPGGWAASVGRLFTAIVSAVRRPLFVPLLGMLAAALLVTGCSSDDKPSTTKTASPTPIANLNTGSMRLSRGEFCSRLPDAAVRAALGGKSTDGTSWRNGDKAQVEDGLTDVVHETGCRFARGTTSASAWVFARPVTTDQAARVIAASAKRKGCTATPGPAFGSPSQRQTCTLDGGARRVRVAGLFGDTWLACQVEAGPDVPAATLSGRADAWCVQAANAANTTK
ncbi:MAG: hypothetical protein JWO46_1772 [Nocardioidaceae bacterium]|nr:hypothetical protein [Nocardioidaceae bacterium]